MNLKQRIIHEDGTVEDIDDRTVMDTLNASRARLMAACEASILEAAPEHAQRNAALNLLEQREAQEIRDAITMRRAHYRSLRTFMEDAAAGWDGTDEDRRRTCDYIESVEWSEP